MLDGNRRRELRYRKSGTFPAVESASVGNGGGCRPELGGCSTPRSFQLRRSEPDAHRDRQEASAIRTADSVSFPTCLGDTPGENNTCVI